MELYGHSRYSNNRNRKKTLVLDIDDSASNDTHLGSGGTFNISLFEPLIIDKHSEVYLDNFITFNSNITNNINNIAFVLKIDEFNINSSVASSNQDQNIINSIIIPNEHGNTDNYHNIVMHKAKKFNYICDINPVTIHSLSGKITNIAGGSAFHGSNSNATFTYTLVNINSWEWGRSNSSLEADESITSITINGVGKLDTTINTNILVHTPDNATKIYFSSDTELTESEFAGCGANPSTAGIIFTIGAVTLTVKTKAGSPNGDDENAAVALIKGYGRFTAEFSIISRE